MRGSAVAGWFLVGSFALAFACGGAGDPAGLFGAPASGSPGGGSGSSSGTASSSGGSGGGPHGGSSSGGSSSGGSSSGGSSGGSSSGGSSSGSSSGGSSGGSSGSSSGSSSGGGDDAGTDPGIYCGKTLTGGTTYCTVGTQACCVRTGASVPSYRCDDANNTSCGNSGGVLVPCDNEAECPNSQLCCGSLDTSSNTYVAVQCQATCDPMQSQYIFCDPSQTPSVCATVPAAGGKPYTCQPSGSLPGYYRCSNQ